MNKLSKMYDKIRLDCEVLPVEAISISPGEIHNCIELAQAIPHQNNQWQTYLNALALFAFQKWLEERADELVINTEQCIIKKPYLASIIPAVGNLQVGEFKLCLIAIGNLTDEKVTFPRAVVDLPEFVPHFYVLVEVLEEQESAIVRGFLSYQQLQEKRTNINLQPDVNWIYQLPLTWFDFEPNTLLLYLRCLKPESIPLPSISANRTHLLSTMQTELTALLPQLHTLERELSDVLTWEQGTVVLTHSDLLNWVYKLQSKTGETRNCASLQNHLKDIMKLLTQPAINVGRWLWDELDQLAQEYSWVLLPNLVPAMAMRSPTEEFEAIRKQLQQHRGLEIPNQARGAYQDLLLAGIPLRLYAVTWHLISPADAPKWTLLLILGTASHENLPYDLQLRVSDQTGVLVEQKVKPENCDAYLFTRVVGSWDEKFVVSMSLVDGVELTLPPFKFYLGVNSQRSTV
ncbi:MAG: DUF1822 family protein [Fischerella sp. CENA71]|nr:DUF1822 family protein [Fischerella sp. CENA71]